MGGSDERCLWLLQAVWTAELTGDFSNADTELWARKEEGGVFSHFLRLGCYFPQSRVLHCGCEYQGLFCFVFGSWEWNASLLEICGMLVTKIIKARLHHRHFGSSPSQPLPACSLGSFLASFVADRCIRPCYLPDELLAIHILLPLVTVN